MLAIIAILTFVATAVGGLVALRFKDKLHLILGFSAGAVIAVAFFDLMPEALELGRNYFSSATMFATIACGFLIYLILDRLIFLHGDEHAHDMHDEHSQGSEISSKPKRGILGAGSLSLHSLLDGISIGLAFQVSAAIGVIVAVAVLVHDFSDGINTVNMIIKNEGGRRQAFKWLIADSFAPVVGICATFFFTVPEKSLAIIIGLFAGFFLYIGASDLIPESHHAHPRFLTTLMTLLGAAVLYVAVRLAGL